MQRKPNHTPSFHWLVHHPKSCFVFMSISFVAFGALSVNMVAFVLANANYLLTYRMDALLDGGIQQLFELSVQVLAALAFYLIFKLCEHALIERIAHCVKVDLPTPQATESSPT